MIVLELLLCVVGFMTMVFLLSVKLKDFSIIDAAWGMGFIVVTLYTLFFHSVNSPKQLLISILVMIWGLRLSVFIWVRNRKTGEDKRYRQMRLNWKTRIYTKAFFRVFMLQAMLMLIISLPIVLVNISGYKNLTGLDAIASIVFLCGLFIETISDHQKFRFKSIPENQKKIVMSGIWKYSRHPNYFGEICVWIGISLIPLSERFGIFGLISPALVILLLLFVSGIPLIEKRHESLPEFAGYKRQTSVLIPWFPKK